MDVQARNGMWDFSAKVEYSPDGQLIATFQGKTVRLWDMATGDLHRGAFQGYAVRSRFLSVNYQVAAKLWHKKTAELQGTLLEHVDEVTSVALSSNNQLLVSGSADKTVRLWDTTTGDLRITLEDGRPFRGLRRSYANWAFIILIGGAVLISTFSQLLLLVFSDDEVRTVRYTDFPGLQQKVSSEYKLTVHAFDNLAKFLWKISVEIFFCLHFILTLFREFSVLRRATGLAHTVSMEIASLIRGPISFF